MNLSTKAFIHTFQITYAQSAATPGNYDDIYDFRTLFDNLLQEMKNMYKMR